MARRQRKRRLSNINIQEENDASEVQTPAKVVDLGVHDDEAEKQQVRKSRARRRSLAITPSRGPNSNNSNNNNNVASSGGGRAVISSRGANYSANTVGSRSNRSSRTRARTGGGGINTGSRSRNGSRVRGRSRGRSPFGSHHSLPQIQLNSNQLTELYKNCIQLSQHNKINQNNAWNLDLVEHMGDIMNKLDDQTNFQRASHTIDAASKIYGYRVDSVHDETYKTLAAFHQGEGGNNNNGNNNGIIDGGEFGDNENGINGMGRKKRINRNRNVGKNTLVNSEGANQITEKLKNMIVEVDPLFHKTATAFDEGGAKGLLMNQLTVQNGCEIVFDSTTKILTVNEENNNDESDEEEIKKEQDWIDTLSVLTIQSNIKNDNNNDNDNDSGEKLLDRKWLQSAKICPILDDLEQNITDIDAYLQRKLTSLDPEAPYNDRSGASDPNNPNGAVGMDGYDSDHPSDDNIMLADITLDGTLNTFNEIEAPDLFADDFEDGMHMQQGFIPGGHDPNDPNGLYNDLSMDPNVAMNAIGPDGNIINPVVMNVDINQNINQHLNSSNLNESMQFRIDSDQLLSQLENDAMNNNDDNNNNNNNNILQPFGRGMNLKEMNNVIEKLEHSDLESLTTFFDPKKHGNWAGPDQWYYRRYMMTVQKHQSYLESQSKLLEKDRKSQLDKKLISHAKGEDDDEDNEVNVIESDDNSNNNNNNNNENSDNEDNDDNKKVKKRKKKEVVYFDFMAIGRGEFVDPKVFEEPKKSDNTLTEAVLRKNEKVTHTLPKDLKVQPSKFIKLFHKPNYNVWKHHLKELRLKMIEKRRQQNIGINGDGMGDIGGINNNNSNMGGMIGRGGGLGGVSDSVDRFGLDENGRESINMMQAAANMVINDNNDDNEDLSPDFYNYNNPNDTSNFVPNVPLDDHEDGFNNNNNNGPLPDLDNINIGIGNDDIQQLDNPFGGFGSNSFDLVEAPNQVGKIKLSFATKAKKVDVRKLKHKMWEQIEKTKPKDRNDNNNNVENSDPNGINNRNEENNEMESKNVNNITFQETLSCLEGELGSRMMSNLSIPFTFIALLHLANEKNLSFVPKDDQLGDFNIKFADPNSIEEIEASNISQVMILGGGNDDD